MEIAEFRQRLASIAGYERYRQFLVSLNHKNRWHGRFLYWQEALLAEAGITAETPAELFDRVEPLLRVCPRHGVELQRDPEGRSRRHLGGIHFLYSVARSEFFPNTDCGPLCDGNSPEFVRDGVWYCPDCRAAEAAWREHTGFSDGSDSR